MRRLAPCLFLIAAACSQSVAHRPSPEITYSGERVLYKGWWLNGVLEEHFDPTDTTRKTSYRWGRADGIEEEFLGDGRRVARREFSSGKKVGTHEGWFADGKKRFVYDYRDNQNHGEAWEWYPSGALAMFARFENGKLLGKKMWRESGQIYMNYVFPGAQAVGLPGTKLCYQVRQL